MAVRLDKGGLTRFAKLGKAINDEMTQTFRDLLQGQVHPSQIYNKAKASKVTFNRLSKDQIVSLHGAQTKGSYDDLDITLMYTLLRNICPNIPPPAKGWGISEFPDVGEVGIGDDIERIRLIRNKVYGHASSASVSQTLFNEYWGMISDICHRFQAHQGGSYVVNLQTILEATIDEEQEQQYIEKLKADCEKDKSILEKVSSIESTVRTLASKQRRTYQKRTGCKSTLKVHVKAKSKSEKAKTTVSRSMEMAKRVLNQLVECINEDADEEDICLLEDSIKEFLESSTGKKHVAFITQLLENTENKIKQNSQHRKIRMAITKRFLSLVLFFQTNYQATFEVDCGSLLFTFYFETRLGYDRFLEDMRKGVIQQELSNVVQYEPFLWIFKLKKDDVIIEVEEYIENGTVKNIEEESTSHEICLQCPGMIETVCDACGGGFCAECWKTHPHHKGESISALPFTHCEIHENVICSKYCKECDTRACDLCVSERHSTHNIIDFSAKYQKLKTDTEELGTELFNIYENIHSNMRQKRKELPQKYEIIKNRIKEEGQIWHDRVDASVDMYIAALESMQNEHLSTLEPGIDKMKKVLQEISNKISQNKEMLNQTSVEDIADYALDIERFRIIPEWSDFKFPIFEPSDVKEEDLKIGNLTPAVRLNVQELHLYPETLALPVRNVKQVIENPVASEHLSSGLSCLTSVALDSEERVWVNGYHHDSPSLFHLSTSSEQPWKVDMFPPEMIIFDMCFKAEGELVFSEIRRGSVNTWKDEQVKTLIEFEDWTPLGIGTTMKHLLICMINIHSGHKKIIRYPWSGHDIKHVEFDENGHPLFSNVNDTLYIAENRNMDLCVSDYGAGRVVVLDKTGKIRFFYDSKELVYSETFGPRGITTDDMSRILVADSNDCCIHVIDRDGTPLSFIRNGDIQVPWTVNVAGDKLIIGDYSGGGILVLKYLE